MAVRIPGKVTGTDCIIFDNRKLAFYCIEGWNALSFVFKDCNTAPYKIHHIGDFEEDAATNLEKMGRSIHILCEVE